MKLIAGTLRPGDRRRSFLRATALALTALAAPASALGASAVSSNWAGYVVRPAAGKRLRSVSGTWVEPLVSCTAGQASYSAVWVGLGGYSQDSAGLEQIGTDADCSSSGQAIYSAWFELLPAAPTDLAVKVRPGDQITAAVTVAGRDATLGIRDLTSGARVSRTVRLKSLDVSSAEWIVEAPSECLSNNSCQTLPLADFGKVAFTNATATLGTATSTIAAGSWSETSLQLEGTQADLATPSETSAADGSFSVIYSEAKREGRAPEGTRLPGFTGGPPG